MAITGPGARRPAVTLCRIESGAAAAAGGK